MRTPWLLVAVVATCLSIPSSALAGTATSNGTTVTFQGAAGAESITIAVANGSSTITGEGATAGDGCQQTDTNVVDCPPASGFLVQLQGGNDAVDADKVGSAATVEIHGGLGDDELRGALLADKLSGDDGSDKIEGGGGNDSLDGGPGDDYIGDSAGNDAVTGGPGNDTWYAGAGTDTFAGGDGSDRADYSARTGNLTLSADGQPNDGESGEGDNIATDVEELVGGSGNDTITGGAQTTLLRGGGGNDAIKAGAVEDRIEAEEGDDVVDARNGHYDSIDCGPGNDTVYADPGDGYTGCETAPDRDGDGFNNDVDCQPDNAAINPAAGEIVGNDVDENCDGIKGYLTVDVAPTYTYDRFNKPWRVRFTSLKVGVLRGGDTIALRCTGKGCPFKTKTLAGRSGTVNLLKLMKKRYLRAGAMLEVTVLRPNEIAKITRLKVTKKGKIKPAKLCLTPGETAPKACS